jgi:hypothetical protein
MQPRIFARCLGTLAVLLAMLTIARPSVQASPQEDNKEVSKLLEDIKVQAAALDKDSDELESFTRSNVSWQGHATELETIKDRINAIGKTISRLQQLRSSASPWQAEAIDRIIPVAQKLASNTTAAIEHLDKNPLRLNTPEYQQYLKSNAEAASQLASMVKEFVDYGKTRTSLEAYERKLELPNK